MSADAKVCSVDGGEHDWQGIEVTRLCTRPISKSATISTGHCGKCQIRCTVTRQGGAVVDVAYEPAPWERP